MHVAWDFERKFQFHNVQIQMLAVMQCTYRSRRADNLIASFIISKYLHYPYTYNSNLIDLILREI